MKKKTEKIMISWSKIFHDEDVNYSKVYVNKIISRQTNDFTVCSSIDCNIMVIRKKEKNWN